MSEQVKAWLWLIGAIIFMTVIADLDRRWCNQHPSKCVTIFKESK